MFCLSTRCLWLALCLPLVVLQPALAAQRKAALRSEKFWPISFPPLPPISFPQAPAARRRVPTPAPTPPPTPASACRTDGIWYSPLGSRTVETVEGCKSRCKSEGQAYFNSFPNGGCHCASSTATTSVNSGNPTAGSGSVDCYETSFILDGSGYCKSSDSSGNYIALLCGFNHALGTPPRGDVEPINPTTCDGFDTQHGAKTLSDSEAQSLCNSEPNCAGYTRWYNGHSADGKVRLQSRIMQVVPDSHTMCFMKAMQNTQFICSAWPEAGTLRSSSAQQCETDAAILTAKLGVPFHCNGYCNGCYGQSGPYLRNTQECEVGDMQQLGESINLGLACHGHFNDGYSGPGKWLKLADCEARIHVLNNYMSCGAVWTQCGGDGWTGPTCCSGNHVCTWQNEHYSQCL